MNVRILLPPLLLLLASCEALPGSGEGAVSPAGTVPLPPGWSDLGAPADPDSLLEAAGPVGTRHPYLFLHAAPDGGWALVCQAREDTSGDGRIQVRIGMHGDTYGDRLVPYLIRGEGPGERLDRVLAVDPTDRRVLVRKGGRVLLLEPASGASLDLSVHGAVASVVDHPLAPPVADFAPSGDILFLVREVASGRAASALDLESGEVRDLDPGEGRVLGVESVAGDRVVRVWTHPRVVGPRFPYTSLAMAECAPPPVSYSVGPGGNVSTSVIDLHLGRRIPWGSHLGLSEGDLLRRLPDGDLVWVAGDGTESLAVEASCGARVQAVGPGRTVVVACVERSGHPLVWSGPDGTIPLIARGRDADVRGWVPRPVASVHAADGRTVLVAMGTGRVVFLEDEADLLAQDGERALIRRSGDRSLMLVDLASGETLPLGITAGSGSRVRSAERWTTVELPDGGTAKIDLAAARVARLPHPRFEAVARGGWILIPDPDRSYGPRWRPHSALPDGPLHWRRLPVEAHPGSP